MTNPFKKNHTAAELNLFRFLARNPLFEKLTFDEMALFFPCLHTRKWGVNEVVFFRNDPAQALYIVKSGSVLISLDIGDTFEMLRHARPSECFGTESLLAGSHRIYNAVADSDDCELYVIPQVNMLEIFDQHPATAAKMFASLVGLHSQSTGSLFRAYQNSTGFFDLNQAFMNEFRI